MNADRTAKWGAQVTVDVLRGNISEDYADELAALRDDKARLDWLIAGGYAPAECRAGLPKANGMIFVGPATRATIDVAMKPAAEASRP